MHGRSPVRRKVPRDLGYSGVLARRGKPVPVTGLALRPGLAVLAVLAVQPPRGTASWDGWDSAEVPVMARTQLSSLQGEVEVDEWVRVHADPVPSLVVPAHWRYTLTVPIWIGQVIELAVHRMPP